MKHAFEKKFLVPGEILLAARSHRRLKLQQVDFRQHGRAPWCALTVSGQGGAFGSLAAAALRAGASADSGILSRHQKFFLQKRLHTKATPLYGQNHFWTGFCQRGHEQFSEFKSPLPGVASAARTSSANGMDFLIRHFAAHGAPVTPPRVEKAAEEAAARGLPVSERDRSPIGIGETAAAKVITLIEHFWGWNRDQVRRAISRLLNCFEPDRCSLTSGLAGSVLKHQLKRSRVDERPYSRTFTRSLGHCY